MQLLIYILVVCVGLVHAIPTASKVLCKDPGPIDHGRRSASKAFHRVGSVILYQCLSGYQIQGGASLTCKDNGNWTKEAPSCKSISCGKPSNINHGNYTGAEFTYLGEVTYRCHVGYQLIGKPKRRCRSNGKWTKKPKCEKHRCQINRRPRLRNGRINITDPLYSHGSKLIFKCNKDYELVGPDEINCRKGRWSHRQLPRCKLLACPNPGFPEYGFRFGNDFRIGRSVRFVCHSGTKLTGSAVRICLKNKQWSGSVAVCDDGITDCPILGIPVSGIKIGNRYQFGSVVRFECEEGYILQGSSIRRCMPDGKWNGTQTKCIEEFQYFVRGVDETAIILRKNIDKMLQYTCSGVNSTCSSTGIDTRARAIDLGEQGGLDVLFVLDASSSIKRKDFKLAKEFAIAIVRQLGATWKPKGTRIAVIVFATEPALVFNFGEHGATSTNGVIKKIRKIKRLGGSTATRHALEMARKVVFVTRENRRQRAMFVITDGRFNIGGNPEEAARNLRVEYKVQNTAIGVGRNVHPRELYAIGKNEEDVIMVNGYEELKKAIDKFVKIVPDYTICGESDYDPRGRIVGGNQAHRKRWPWQIGLHRLDIDGRLKLYCGGALIDKRWVLTTAICFGGRARYSIPEFWTVKAGDYDLEEEDPSEQELRAEQIFIYPGYKPSPFYENDIALVKLRRDVKLGPFVRTVCLPKNNEELLEPGNVGFVAGWGVTEKLLPGQPPSAANSRSKVLLQSAFEIQNVKLCREKTKFHLNLNVTFCAGDGKGGNGTCKGDSGGSFVRHVQRNGELRWVSAGLVSWGEGCGLKDKYEYYTRVAPFVEWIEKTIRENTP
ncbi:complement C2-like isoform X2 [Actinia tenebrosa]|uniref:C3/C5 convertase n=1 Tax=Actinia tenebrosa TaxID=6105 RepID=A0A6P8J4X6_ACTTE|nr:complement C2-like isoform X2 [Actinia tenebrosa]